jgi:putative FmdB family regulatory protein
MPIYEYECRECGHIFDALQKMSDEPLIECPDCGKPELRKLLSAPNFRLKGGGWYETDFKDKNKRNIAGDGDKPAKTDKSESTSSDKPEKTSGDAGSGTAKLSEDSGDPA